MSFKTFYKTTIVPALIKEMNYKNIHAVPKLVKAVLNVGFGKLSKEPKIMETVESVLKRITGQKPILTKAKKSISNFKVRQGQIIGAKVTLRGKRMNDFLEKLVKISLPRVRDFRGLPLKSLDKQGNLSLGFKEYIAFPEIRSDEVEKLFGLEISIQSNAKTRPEALRLFQLLGFPFQAK